MKNKLNRSEARKKYWASLSPEEKTKRGRLMAIAKAKKMTPKERLEHAMMMVRARRKKSP